MNRIIKHSFASLFAVILTFAAFTLSAQTTIYVVNNATGNNDGSSWVDAYTDLQAALDVAVAIDQE